MCYFVAALLEEIQKLKEKLKALEAILKVSELRKEVETLDAKIASPEFWSDPKGAAEVQRRRSGAQSTLVSFDQLSSDISDLEEFAPLADAGDAELAKELSMKLSKVQKTTEELEFQRVLGGEFDRSSAILSINSGAGGTESQDWVQMLLRMYLRWAEEKGFASTIVDSQPGEEAGLKNVTVMVEGAFAFGYLSCEAGIHRLVRISPFDANARRHTSFAAVQVLPELEDDVAVEIKDEDLRVDTFRASGAGGQHVNKTDSAVRLTHLPTGIVVACQNERSQHKNRSAAMKILRSKLYELQVEAREKEKAKLVGEKKEIGFGSQIRSYVLQPYQMIKDHRTDFEVGNVQAVLDGQIDGFIRAFLLKRAETK